MPVLFAITDALGRLGQQCGASKFSAASMGYHSLMSSWKSGRVVKAPERTEVEIPASLPYTPVPALTVLAVQSQLISEMDANSVIKAPDKQCAVLVPSTLYC